MEYADTSLQAATVTVVTFQKVNVSLTYTYNGVPSSSPVSQYSSKTVNLGPEYAQLEDSLYVVVNGTDGSYLVLEPIDFIWSNPVISQAGGVLLAAAVLTLAAAAGRLPQRPEGRHRRALWARLPVLLDRR